MKNKYIIDGDSAIIYWYSEKLDKNFEIFVDAEDIHKLIEIGYSIYCKQHKRNYYYPVITRRIMGPDGKKKYETRCLHSFLVDCSSGYDTDHINNNNMDNRKENLRIIEHKHNIKNRKGKNSNNKSGYRNVCWIEGKWLVQLQINGKSTRLGKFDDVHEAGRFAEEMRTKYYGEYKGKS